MGNLKVASNGLTTTGGRKRVGLHKTEKKCSLLANSGSTGYGGRKRRSKRTVWLTTIRKGSSMKKKQTVTGMIIGEGKSAKTTGSGSTSPKRGSLKWPGKKTMKKKNKHVIYRQG